MGWGEVEWGGVGWSGVGRGEAVKHALTHLRRGSTRLYDIDHNSTLHTTGTEPGGKFITVWERVLRKGANCISNFNSRAC